MTVTFCLVNSMLMSSRAIATTICQLIYLPRRYEADFTFRGFPWYLSTQFVQSTSITASCVAYYWPFLRSLRTGLMAGDNRTFRSEYNLSKLTRSNQSTIPDSVLADRREMNSSNYIEITTDNTVISGTREELREHGIDVDDKEEIDYMKRW